MATADGLNPYDYQKIFGLTFCKHEHRPLITVGKTLFSRWELGRLGVPHSAAAVHLDRAIQELRISTMDELAHNAHTLGQFRGLGVTAYAVLMAILRASGYDIEQVHETDVSYHAMKRRALKEQPARKLKRRKR